MISESQMNEAPKEAFPELAPELEKYTSWQDGMDTGAFLTYEDVLRPRIEQAIESGDEDCLSRAREFIESLFTSGDPHAANVVTVGILEGLKANCDNDSVRAFLAPESLREFDSLAY